MTNQRFDSVLCKLLLFVALVNVIQTHEPGMPGDSLQSYMIHCSVYVFSCNIAAQYGIVTSKMPHLKVIAFTCRLFVICCICVILILFPYKITVVVS